MSNSASKADNSVVQDRARDSKPKTPMTPSQAIAQAVALMNEGKLQQAERICQQVIAARPNLPEAHNILGVVQYRQGQADEGIKSIKKAIKLNATVANYYANLGEMLRQQRETDKAITALRRATHLDPNSAQAFNNIGIAYFDKAKFEDAATMYQKAISLDPNYAEPHNNLGNALLALGKAQDAVKSYEQALALRPDYAEALGNSAMLLGRTGKFEEAEASLRRTLELRPDNLETYRYLADVLVHRNKLDEAVKVLNEAVKRGPKNVPVLITLARAHLKRGANVLAERIAKEALSLDEENPEVRCVLGQACFELDRPHEAIEHYEKALKTQPGNGEARHFLAVALKAVGDFKRAEAELKALIDKQPGLVPAYSSIADMVKFTEDHPYFLSMQKLAEEIGDAQNERAMFLHYALGKAYDDVGDYEKAFKHFESGAGIKRSLLNFDEESSKKFFDEIKRLYNAEFFASTGVKGHPSTLPIFIIGMPRSGSTLVEQVLASHPDVHGAGEIKVVAQGLHDVRRVFSDLSMFPQLGLEMKQSHFDHFARFYLNTTAKLSEDASHITDKLLTNYYFLGIINKAFPNAKVIHTMRNPVDTCLSMYTKLFKDDMPHSYDLQELGRYYKRYESLMEHWRDVLPEDYMLDVQYEDMVGSLEEKAKEIVSFCGLDWDDRCLRFHDSDRPVKTASVAQVRKPLYSTSVERWRRYERQLSPLLEALGWSE